MGIARTGNRLYLRGINTFNNILRAMLTIVLILIVLFIVYITDGTKNVYLHLIYVPIIVSASYWGIIGGLISAVIAGGLAGPLMPLSVSQGIMQSPENWITRLIIFAFVGMTTGHVFSKVKHLDNVLIESNFISPITGIYNINKLMNIIEERITYRDSFAIGTLKLTNIEGVGKYIDHRFKKVIIDELIKDLLEDHGRDSVYSSNQDEIMLILDINSNYISKCEKILSKYSKSFMIRGSEFLLSLKIGIYEYNGDDEAPIEIFNKARISYEQGSDLESAIYFYQDGIDKPKKEFLEISGSLLEAINKNELYLVYQPQIDILNSTIRGVEVLIRWDRGDKKPVTPLTLIKIAEDIGHINEISKFVIDNATTQIVNWRNKGIQLSVAINLTTKELLNDEFISWAKTIVEDKGIEKSMCEIELTERMVSNECENLATRLQQLRTAGYKIAIDDFGTGVNSLMRMIEVPFDILKIDKYFIDHVDRFEVRELIKAIIRYAHEFNKGIVAEGVESREQLDVLRELGCDFIQGYYYCKPLLPSEFEEYYTEFCANKQKYIVHS